MSSETNWTPGPWRPMPCYDHIAQGVEAEGRDIVLWRGMARPRSTESIANVRLIAAAPDLYEALDEISDLMQGVIDGDYEPDSFTLQVSKAALAKARGES